MLIMKESPAWPGFQSLNIDAIENRSLIGHCLGVHARGLPLRWKSVASPNRGSGGGASSIWIHRALTLKGKICDWVLHAPS